MLKMKMKIKIRCFKVLLWMKKNHYNKIFITYKSERSSAPFTGIWTCTTSELSCKLFPNLIQGRALDHNTCSNCPLLFRSDLFNYVLYLRYLGSFKFIDSFFEDMTKIMKGWYSLLEPLYLLKLIKLNFWCAVVVKTV